MSEIFACIVVWLHVAEPGAVARSNLLIGLPTKVTNMELPGEVVELIDLPSTCKVITTHDANGQVHSIYMGSLMAPSRSELIFGRVRSRRTHQNLMEMRKRGGTATVLVTEGMRSFEIRFLPKEYTESGPALDKVNGQLAEVGLKACGAWILEPTEVWNQGAVPEAGTRVV